MAATDKKTTDNSGDHATGRPANPLAPTKSIAQHLPAVKTLLARRASAMAAPQPMMTSSKRSTKKVPGSRPADSARA